jgi:hypothetical protein
MEPLILTMTETEMLTVEYQTCRCDGPIVFLAFYGVHGRIQANLEEPDERRSKQNQR